MTGNVLLKSEHDPEISKDFHNMSGFSSSLPASVRNISKVFKPSPFQKKVTETSFIIENPSQFYLNKNEDNLPPPIKIQHDSPESIPQAANPLYHTSPTPTNQTPDIKPSIHELLSSEKSTSSLLDSLANQLGDMEQPRVNLNSSATSQLPDLTTFEIDILNNDLNHQVIKSEPLSVSDKSNDLSFTDTDSQLVDIPFADDKLFSISSIDLNSLEFSQVDDFEKDLEAIENTKYFDKNSKYSNLLQVPLRDSHSNTLSASGSLFEHDDNHTYALESIPRSLDFLPDLLLNVPMYKELFHHFFFITADLLVPAPSIYPQNPFKTILPSMAISTPHLLALLLAFSANHRARYLHTAIPEEIVSRLLTRAYQGFIKCLENKQMAKSDTTLATAILLSSYDIFASTMSPSWKTHMHGARDIVVARDIAQSLLDQEQQKMLSYDFKSEATEARPTDSDPKNQSPQMSPRTHFSITDNKKSLIGPRPLGLLKSDIDETNVSFFLIRWFAYIDVIGSLTSCKATAFLTTNENMSQLWGLHDWHLERIKKRSLSELYESRTMKLSKRSNSNDSLSSLSQKSSPKDAGNDSDILNVSARHYGIKVDFLLGIDLDVLPLFSKISFFVRQRRRLTKSLEAFIMDHPNIRMDNIDAIFNGEFNDEYLPSVREWIHNWKTSDQELIKEATELSSILISLCEAYEVRRQNYVNGVLGVLEKKRRDSASSSQHESPEYLQIHSPSFYNKDDLTNSDDSNSFVFSEQCAQQLNSLLKRSENLIPNTAQLPASVQAHSQLSILNATFCYGAIIQLYRRAMNIPCESPLVQRVVKHSTFLMDTYIPPGSPVECCMSFPIFSIGCEAVDPDIQRKYSLRLQGMERFGIAYAQKVLELMEISWKRKQNWTDIVEGRDWDFALM